MCRGPSSVSRVLILNAAFRRRAGKFMQLRCKPLEPPIEWGRYTSQAQEVIVVSLNAGDLLQPSWYEAVFDLEVFDSSWGTRREVHAFVSEADGLQTLPLAQWVTTVKPSLRGNAKGVLYYDGCGKWCRLQALLDERVQVGHHTFCVTSARCSLLGLIQGQNSGRAHACKQPVHDPSRTYASGVGSISSPKYLPLSSTAFARKGPVASVDSPHTCDS